MREGSHGQRAVRLLVLIAALGMFAGTAITATAAQPEASRTMDDCVPRPPHGWFC